MRSFGFTPQAVEELGGGGGAVNRRGPWLRLRAEMDWRENSNHRFAQKVLPARLESAVVVVIVVSSDGDGSDALPAASASGATSCIRPAAAFSLGPLCCHGDGTGDPSRDAHGILHSKVIYLAGTDLATLPSPTTSQWTCSRLAGLGLFQE